MEERAGVPVREGLFSTPSIEGEQSYLIGSKCRKCGLVCFPQRAVCPTCLTDDTVSQIRLSGKAKLEVFVEATVGVPGFPAPYLHGFVVLEEGCRIYTYIDGAKKDELKEGMDLEVEIGVVGQRKNSEQFIGYKFHPRKAGK